MMRDGEVRSMNKDMLAGNFKGVLRTEYCERRNQRAVWTFRVNVNLASVKAPKTRKLSLTLKNLF